MKKEYIAAIVVMMMCCSSSSVASMMMGGGGGDDAGAGAHPLVPLHPPRYGLSGCYTWRTAQLGTDTIRILICHITD
jgi:hypothetical protein